MQRPCSKQGVSVQEFQEVREVQSGSSSEGGCERKVCYEMRLRGEGSQYIDVDPTKIVFIAA